ncbi:MAG: DUF6050 family protein [Clostridia bacterium]
MYGSGYSAGCRLPPSDASDRAGRRLLGGGIALFALNFIIGGVIGGFILAWRLIVAVWYVPPTVYRLIVADFASWGIWKTAARADGKIHNLMEKDSLFPQVCKQLSHSLTTCSLRTFPQRLLRRNLLSIEENPFMLKLKYIF